MKKSPGRLLSIYRCRLKTYVDVGLIYVLCPGGNFVNLFLGEGLLRTKDTYVSGHTLVGPCIT